MKALILAAGYATRLRPLTDSVPKQLLPVGGRPMVDWILDKLREAEIDDVHVDVGREALPGYPVDARDMEEVPDPARDQPPLAAGDARDEELLARLRAPPRTRRLRRRRRREVEELLRTFAGNARHGGDSERCHDCPGRASRRA